MASLHLTCQWRSLQDGADKQVLRDMELRMYQNYLHRRIQVEYE